MAVDLIAIAKISDMLMEKAGDISRPVTYALTTPPSILIQNCAFLTIFLAAIKILMSSSHYECRTASTSPEIIEPLPCVSDVDGPDDIGFVPRSPSEANTTAPDPALQPDSPRYLTRHKVRILEEKSGVRNGGRTHSKMTRSAYGLQRNEVGRSKVAKQRRARKKQKYPGYVFVDDKGDEIVV
ncbi:hypothetical protein B0H14DRAFT_3148009 [Mycena olivaceomarginata]|nr:hypothetical protein B0H14DRAFT_3148009 [Mycena olivaceomarginata]